MEKHSNRSSGAMKAAVLVFAGGLLSFGLSDGRAEAAEKVIEVQCPAQKNVDVTVPADIDSVRFDVKGQCWCSRDIGQLKSAALAGQFGSARFLDTRQAPGYEVRAPIKPGETVEVKIYCYTPSMLVPAAQ